jgi:hypothetical protein
MDYFLDTEFDGYQGKLISLAMINEKGKSIYAYIDYAFPGEINTDWVRENVIPVLFKHDTNSVDIVPIRPNEMIQLSKLIESFLAGDPNPHIIADWPDDFKYFSELVLTGPGTMINSPRLTMEVVRVDAYPTIIPNAVQHNAWWDAVALRYKLSGNQPQFDQE